MESGLVEDQRPLLVHGSCPATFYATSCKHSRVCRRVIGYQIGATKVMYLAAVQLIKQLKWKISSMGYNPELPNPTNDDIEVRILCIPEGSQDDIAIHDQLLELYFSERNLYRH